MNQSPIQSAAVLASCEAKWAERVEKLQAEVAAAKSSGDLWAVDCCNLLSALGVEFDPQQCDPPMDEAIENLDALKRDKERLDYLITHFATQQIKMTRENIDAAIDAAMTPTPKDQKQ